MDSERLRAGDELSPKDVFCFQYRGAKEQVNNIFDCIIRFLDAHDPRGERFLNDRNQFQTQKSSYMGRLEKAASAADNLKQDDINELAKVTADIATYAMGITAGFAEDGMPERRHEIRIIAMAAHVLNQSAAILRELKLKPPRPQSDKLTPWRETLRKVSKE